MIRFNRATTPFSVLSFDLDDTLYNNHPIIKAAVQAQTDYLNTLPNWQAQGKQYWQQCREEVAQLQPELIDDVTNWRKATLHRGLKKLDYNEYEVQKHTKAAYQAFANARSNIIVQNEVLLLLKNLAKHYRLIAITNGNVEIERFNLNGVFELVLQAGIHGKAKPNPGLFQQAAAKLNVQPKDILHIGDSLDTDVQGAHNAGCQSVWLNNQQTHYAYKGLADIEISDIQALNHLISE